MALENYGMNLDQLEIHLAAMAGLLGSFRKALIEQGFAEEEAAALCLAWWHSALNDPEA